MLRKIFFVSCLKLILIICSIKYSTLLKLHILFNLRNKVVLKLGSLGLLNSELLSALLEPFLGLEAHDASAPPLLPSNV